MEKRKIWNKIKTGKGSVGTRQGTYSVGITALVIAIVVAVNLIVGQLPEKYRNLDVSSANLYEITDTSKTLLKGLDQDVDMTVLAVKDETDDRITTFLSKYASLSKHIKVTWVDPVLHPSALSEYNGEENSIVVSCKGTGRTTTVNFSDIIVQDMSSYYYSGSPSESEFDGEGQLTSAVNYVTTDTAEKIYRTTGHGEATLSSTITDLLDKNSYTTEELNLMMAGAVPEDCDLLLMYAPAKDLSEDEEKVLQQYLQKGGHVMILLGDTAASEIPNLSALLKEYGMTETEGYLADPQRSYQNNPYMIFPQLNVSGDMAKGISSEMVLLTNARGLTLTDPARDTITTSAFMTTSDKAYNVTETSQAEGAYTIGATSEETITQSDGSSTEGEDNTEDQDGTDESKTVTSRLTVISAASLIDSNITDTFTTLENTTLFMNAVTANFDGVTNISIEPKSLSVQYNTVRHGGLFSLAVIFGIPAVLLIGGFMVWYRRRKV